VGRASHDLYMLMVILYMFMPGWSITGPRQLTRGSQGVRCPLNTTMMRACNQHLDTLQTPCLAWHAIQAYLPRLTNWHCAEPPAGNL
jgi:hypothetical protein